MFGNGMMKKLQQMQEQVEEEKARLSNITISGESGPVKVDVDGNGVVKNIQCSENLDQEALIDYIILASNKALDQANRTKEMEMAQSAKGIIPGM